MSQTSKRKRKKKRAPGASQMGQGMWAEFKAAPRLVMAECVDMKVNVPGRFWPTLARGQQKDKLFLCSVIECEADHQFAGSLDRKEALRITADASTAEEDKFGYWINMKTFSTFKVDHGPKVYLQTSGSDDGGESEGGGSDAMEIVNSNASAGAKGDGIERSPFWAEFAFTGKTGPYTTGVNAEKGKWFEFWRCLTCNIERKIVKNEIEALVTHCRDKHKEHWTQLRMLGPDTRWVGTAKGAIPKYTFKESFEKHVAFCKYLIEDLKEPHASRRKKKASDQDGVVIESGFRAYVKTLDKRAYPPGQRIIQKILASFFDVQSQTPGVPPGQFL